MFDPQEEQAKMDLLLEAFRSYIDALEEYEIFYTKKRGYLRVIVDDNRDHIYFPIEGYADMLRMLVDDHLHDEEVRVEHSLKLDYDHVRSLLIPRLDALGEYREEACAIMEKTMDDCRRDSELFHQLDQQEERESEELPKHLQAGLYPGGHLGEVSLRNG